MTTSLLGVILNDVNPEKTELDELLLHDINLGYLDPTKLQPHSSIAFHKESNEFFHPWSIQSIGEQYGYGKLEDVIPLHDYLTLPANLVNGLISGIIKGKERRIKETTPPDSKGGISKEEKEAMAFLAKMGKT